MPNRSAGHSEKSNKIKSLKISKPAPPGTPAHKATAPAAEGKKSLLFGYKEIRPTNTGLLPRGYDQSKFRRRGRALRTTSASLARSNGKKTNTPAQSNQALEIDKPAATLQPVNHRAPRT